MDNNDILERWEALFLKVKNFPHYRLAGFLEAMIFINTIHVSERDTKEKLSRIIPTICEQFNVIRDDICNIPSDKEKQIKDTYDKIREIDDESIPYLNKYYKILSLIIPIIEYNITFIKSIETKYINKLYSNISYNEILLPKEELESLSSSKNNEENIKILLLRIINNHYIFIDGMIIGLRLNKYINIKDPPFILTFLDEGELYYSYTGLKKYYRLPGFLVHINYITVESIYKFPFSSPGLSNKIL